MIAALVMGSYVLAVLMAAVAFFGFFLSTVKGAASSREADLSEGIDADSKTLLVPIKRLTEELNNVVGLADRSSATQLVGNESIDAAKSIQSQVVHALRLRTELRKTVRGKSLANAEIVKLEEGIAEATTDAEREALQLALKARQQELKQYDIVTEKIAQIDQSVRHAEAALLELKATLLSNRVKSVVEGRETEDIRETVSRVKAVSSSFDEVTEMLDGSA